MDAEAHDRLQALAGPPRGLCVCTASNSLAGALLRFSTAILGQPVDEIDRRQLVEAYALRRVWPADAHTMR